MFMEGRVHVRRMRGEQKKKAAINICGGESACEKDERRSRWRKQT